MYIPKASKFDPDENGHFGIFGGRYVPETLMPALLKLSEEYDKIRFDKDFWEEEGWVSCFECDIIFYDLEKLYEHQLIHLIEENS